MLVSGIQQNESVTRISTLFFSGSIPIKDVTEYWVEFPGLCSSYFIYGGFPSGSDGKESTCRLCGRPGFDPWDRKIPWRGEWQPLPVFLPGESHGQKNLAGYSPWGRKQSDTTEQLQFHFHFIYRSVCMSVSQLICPLPFSPLVTSLFSTRDSISVL